MEDGGGAGSGLLVYGGDRGDGRVCGGRERDVGEQVQALHGTQTGVQAGHLPGVCGPLGHLKDGGEWRLLHVKVDAHDDSLTQRAAHLHRYGNLFCPGDLGGYGYGSLLQGCALVIIDMATYSGKALLMAPNMATDYSRKVSVLRDMTDAHCIGF